MRFSEIFRIAPAAADDWFDPILSLDTPLFIDPFLLYHHESDAFAGSHSEVISFFNTAFSLVARSGGDHSSLSWRRAHDLLQFPEVEELCLGYAGSGTKGAGSGPKLGSILASALWEAVQQGLTSLRHFEEVQLFRTGIGADRISDITACLLRRTLAQYTRQVAETHSVPLEPVNYLRGAFDSTSERWCPLHTALPRNPFNSKPVLLVPRRYLRDLPSINADSFWEHCYSNENDVLRREYGDDISRHVNKPVIIDFARRHPDARNEYVRRKEAQVTPGYDFSVDPKGLVSWYDTSLAFCQTHPLSLKIATPAALCDAVRAQIREYQHFIEQNEGWRALYNDDGSQRKESIAQLLFLGIVKHYCKANDIDISREPNIGRGPVDFKVSRGYQLRALIELKKASNSKFWNGLGKQLPAYLKAEQIDLGFFVVVAYSDADVERVADVQAVVRAVSQATGLTCESFVVDARRPLSASRL